LEVTRTGFIRPWGHHDARGFDPLRRQLGGLLALPAAGWLAKLFGLTPLALSRAVRANPRDQAFL